MRGTTGPSVWGGKGKKTARVSILKFETETRRSRQNIFVSTSHLFTLATQNSSTNIALWYGKGSDECKISCERLFLFFCFESGFSVFVFLPLIVRGHPPSRCVPTISRR